MANATSVAISGTLQSLEGVNVSTAAGPALFRESVVAADPTDPVGYGAVVSSQPLSTIYGYAIWVQGTPTVAVSGTSSVNVISSVPHALVGTSNVFVVSSVVNTVTVQGTSSVNVLGNVTIQGTSSVNPIGTTQVNVVSSLALTIQGTSSVNVLNTVTIQGTSSANILGGGVNVSAAVFSAAISTAPANIVYMGGRVSTTNPTSIGNASTAPFMVDRSGSVIAAPALRDMMSATTVTMASTAAETTIIPATASEFHDITNIFISNASSSAQTLTIRDGTAQTQRLVLDFNSTFANPINLNFNPPLAQSTSNANWTLQPSTNTLFHAHVAVSWIRKST